uniref:Uncharacterized protein n=1 Tax=Anguilla anguilla TaxID=7936 RepID=A0A0E9V615_ANGAN
MMKQILRHCIIPECAFLSWLFYFAILLILLSFYVCTKLCFISFLLFCPSDHLLVLSIFI